MDAMLNLVKMLLQEKVAGCARCSATDGPGQDPTITGLLNVVSAFVREMKEKEKLVVSLGQSLKISRCVLLSPFSSEQN